MMTLLAQSFPTPMSPFPNEHKTHRILSVLLFFFYSKKIDNNKLNTAQSTMGFNLPHPNITLQSSDTTLSPSLKILHKISLECSDPRQEDSQFQTMAAQGI
jgi:hypothetical protein